MFHLFLYWLPFVFRCLSLSAAASVGQREGGEGGERGGEGREGDGGGDAGGGGAGKQSRTKVINSMGSDFVGGEGGKGAGGGGELFTIIMILNFTYDYYHRYCYYYHC